MLFIPPQTTSLTPYNYTHMTKISLTYLRAIVYIECTIVMCTSVKQHASQTAHLTCFYMAHSYAHPNLLSLIEGGQEHNGRGPKLPHKLPEITLGVGHGRLSCNEGLWNRVALWRKWDHVHSEINFVN